MTAKDSFKIVLTYFAISFAVLLAGYLFPEQETGYITGIPTLLSVLLLIPFYAWYKNSCKKIRLSAAIEEKDEHRVIFWILALFVLALFVRVPSVLLFNKPYEKTPLIFLIIATMLVIERTDVSAFGFKTRNMAKSLFYGLMFFVTLDGLSFFLTYLLFYIFTNQAPVLSYNVVPFLLTMPFMTLCVGISEEGLFRGYMQTHLERFYTIKRAILIQAILFGLWHFVWNVNPFDPSAMIQYVFYTFIVGLLFGYFYSKTRNLVPLIFAHGLIDAVPSGNIVNQAASDIFQTIPLQNQILTLILPYVISVMVTLFFIRYLAKEI